jgi:hypothetical protein
MIKMLHGRTSLWAERVKSLIGLSVALGVMAALFGCTTLPRQSSYPRSLAYPSGEYSVPIVDLASAKWGVCTNEAEAEVVLIFQVTISGVMDKTKVEFPLRRVFSFDVEGRPNEAAGLIMRGFNSDGVSRDGKRGVGCGGSYLIESQDGRSVLVKIAYYWTTDAGSKEYLQAEIPCLIGVADEWALSETARLQVSYRRPQPTVK